MDTTAAPLLDPCSVDLGTVPLERIESELSSLSAHLAAAECRWLLLLAEFDRRGGWQVWGCHSAVHWLNWKLGLDTRTGYEKLRVAHRLVECPLIAEAFARGELSYSKVRAITRIAEPKTEETLVQWCRHATASHIERIAGAKRRANRRDEAEAERQRDERWFRVSYDGSGWGRATIEAPSEFLKVIEAAVRCQLKAMERDAKAAARSEERPAECSAEHSPDLARGAPSWLDLPMAARKADAFVQLITTFLEDLNEREPAGDDRYLVNVHVGVDQLSGENPDGLCELEDGPDISAEMVKRLLCGSSVVLHADDHDGNPLFLGRKSYRPSRAQRRAAKRRDKTCRFPSCERTIVEIHHGDEWEHGGHTNVDRLLSLCSFHHHLCHEGGFRAEIVGSEVRFYRPDGMLLSVEPLHRPSDSPDLAVINAQLGLDIDHRTNESKWDGSAPDYDLCMDALFSREGKYRPPHGTDLN
jgi:hypothetical protein